MLQGRSVGREDIGVLTFYDAQNKCVTRSCDMRGTTVANVDGFQGSERPVMILSTVRTTRSGHIGFTKDPRRINVALTRAQRGLIVIGDFHALHAGDTYGHWKSWLEQVPVFDSELVRVWRLSPQSGTSHTDDNRKTQAPLQDACARMPCRWRRNFS